MQPKSKLKKSSPGAPPYWDLYRCCTTPANPAATMIPQSADSGQTMAFAISRCITARRTGTMRCTLTSAGLAPLATMLPGCWYEGVEKTPFRDDQFLRALCFARQFPTGALGREVISLAQSRRGPRGIISTGERVNTISCRLSTDYTDSHR